MTVTIKAQTPHAAYSRLWLLPKGGTDWQDEREIADGSTNIAGAATYDVDRGTYLGWNLSVGTTAGATDYVVTLTLRQGSTVVKNGIITIEGRTDAGGVDVDIDHVLLQ